MNESPLTRDEMRAIVRQWMGHHNQLAVITQFYPEGAGNIRPMGDYSEVSYYMDAKGNLRAERICVYRVRC